MMIDLLCNYRFHVSLFSQQFHNIFVTGLRRFKTVEKIFRLSLDSIFLILLPSTQLSFMQDIRQQVL